MFSELDVLSKQLCYLAFLCEVLHLSAIGWTSERWKSAGLLPAVAGRSDRAGSTLTSPRPLSAERPR